MPQLTLDQAIQLATSHFQNNRFPEAESICQQILATHPNHPDALQLLGLIANQFGKPDLAVQLVTRAVAASPASPHYRCNLGIVLMSQGKLQEAIACYQQVLQRTPDFFPALYNLAHAFRQEGKFDQSIAAFRRIRTINPDYLPARHDLAGTLAINGQLREADISLYGTDAPAPPMIPAPPDPSAPKPKIFAICSIRNGRVDLLPHWLDYYSNLGVDKLLLGIFDDLSPEIRADVDACATRYPFLRFPQNWQVNNDTSEALHEDQRRSACRDAGADSQTWIIHTDLDEFHQFPAPLPQITAAATARGIKAIAGWQLDRVAADGSLPAIRPAPPSLFDQFPVGCHITHRIMHIGLPKILLARFDVPVGIGHHFTASFNDMPTQIPLGRPDQYLCNHFKWHAESLLRWYASMPTRMVSQQWRNDTGRVLAWLQSNGGKIILDHSVI